MCVYVHIGLHLYSSCSLPMVSQLFKVVITAKALVKSLSDYFHFRKKPEENFNLKMTFKRLPDMMGKRNVTDPSKI